MVGLDSFGEFLEYPLLGYFSCDHDENAYFKRISGVTYDTSRHRNVGSILVNHPPVLRSSTPARLAIATGLAVAVLSLSGCGEREVIKTHMTCMVAASELGDQTAMAMIHRKVSEYAHQENFDMSSRDLMMMRQEITDELDVAGKSDMAAMFSFIKIYNSSDCQEIHEQPSISPPFGFWSKVMYYLGYFFY